MMHPQEQCGPTGCTGTHGHPEGQGCPFGQEGAPGDSPTSCWVGRDRDQGSAGSMSTLLGIVSLLPPPANPSHTASGFPVLFSSSGVGLGHQSALAAAERRWCLEQGGRTPVPVLQLWVLRCHVMGTISCGCRKCPGGGLAVLQPRVSCAEVSSPAPSSFPGLVLRARF